MSNLSPNSLPILETSYARLPAVFHSQVKPYGASTPSLLKLNAPLAEVLGFDVQAFSDDQAAELFSGNRLFDGSEPLAMAYAGHQFGGFNPGLGDGRALLLGDVIGRDGKRYDIQLKGSGQTPYSRQGDGRAALGPVLREYVISEAMHALGIPTTRALAAVTTGDPVLREQMLPGAMVTRVASSHLRVGTFEFAAIQQDHTKLEALTDFALARHYPDADPDKPKGLRLLETVMERQARLVARWMGIGFIHGVMNTDNCTISGETIDYGPCAFMDGYNPSQVYSSIDAQGRYAFANQPPIAHWNMAILAQTLLPMIDPDEDQAVRLAQETVNGFQAIFADAYQAVMRDKLGLKTIQTGDGELARDLLVLMAEEEADFTGTFRALTGALHDEAAFKAELSNADTWLGRWKERLLLDGDVDPAERLSTMRLSSPAVIPRNHRVEAMIASAMEGDLAPFHTLVDALATPYDDLPQNGERALLAQPPKAEEVIHATFCGT
jgi:uncharacterized protein YdiU (UPF0061 family)